MFPIFLWVREYKGLKDFRINLDSNYEIELEIESSDNCKIRRNESGRQKLGDRYKEGVKGIVLKKLEIKKNKLEKMEGFYGDYIDSIKALIGKNGVGKSSILEIMSVFSEGNDIYMKGFHSHHENIEFLIIHKTNEIISGKEIFILDGYTPYKNEDYFKCINNLNNSNIIDYFNFKIDIENNFISLLKNTDSFGIIRMSPSIKIDNYQIELIKMQNDNRKSKVYKLNLGYKNISKQKLFNYINEKNKNRKYNGFSMIVSIINRNNYLNEIGVKCNSKITYLCNEKLFLYNLSQNEIANLNITELILRMYCDYLYQYKIYKKIEKIIDLEEINKIIDFEYKNNVKKQNIIDTFNSLLEEINYLEDIKKLKDYILILCEKLEKIYKKSFVEIVPEYSNQFVVSFKLKYDKMTNDEIQKIEDLLEFYDCTTIYNHDLYTDEVSQIINIKEQGMSDGEKIWIEQFSTLYRVLNGEFKNKKYITLLLDEPETSLHPELCRRLLNEYIEELKRYKNKKFKIIYATHSPFILGDILSNDMIVLEKKDGKSYVEKNIELKTFSGNIHNLLKMNMFMTSTFGEFSKNKIKNFLKQINNAKTYIEIKNISNDFLIEEIAEPLIYKKIKSIISEKMKELSVESEDYYQYKIEKYEEKIREYKDKIKNKN